MEAKFLGENKRELRRNDGDANENGKKAIGLDKQNNNFARASRFFVHFLAVIARLRRPLYGVGNHNTQKFSFPFCKLRYCTFGFNPEISPTFDKLNETEYYNIARVLALYKSY